MNLFSFGTHSWECTSQEYFFIHPNKNEEEFKNDCITLMKKHRDKCIEDCIKNNETISLEKIYELAIEDFKDLGYISINPISKSYIEHIPKERHYLFEQVEPQFDEVGFDEEMKNKMIDHNRKVFYGDSTHHDL